MRPDGGATVGADDAPGSRPTDSPAHHAGHALRGHLAEFGLVEAQGLHKVARLIAIVMDEIDARVPDIARRVLKVIVSQIEDILAKPLQPRGFVSPRVCLPGKPKSAYIHASSGVIWGLTVKGRNDAVQLTLKGIAHEALLCPRRLLHGPAHRRP